MEALFTFTVIPSGSWAPRTLTSYNGSLVPPIPSSFGSWLPQWQQLPFHPFTPNGVIPFSQLSLTRRQALPCLAKGTPGQGLLFYTPSPFRLIASLWIMATDVFTGVPTRRYERIFLPQGMFVAWYGGGDQQISRAQTLGMGGAFLAVLNPPAVGTTLRLVFEVPGGNVRADGVVRNVSLGKGMGVEFVKMGPQDRILLDRLLKRLLR